MSLEFSLRDISEGLKSNRITERKKNAESLKEFLNRNAVPSLLTENTLKKKGYSWNDLFDDINEYIFKETDKYESSKTFESSARPLCTNLIHLCVAGSNKGKAYIKCDKITDACLIILKDGRLKKAIGDAFLNLLYKHVLPCEYYLGFITYTTWEDLLDVSLSACLSKQSTLDNYTKLRLVLLIMRNAKNYCQFVTPLRDILPKWRACLEKVVTDKKSQEVVVEIMVLLLDALSAECRRTLCNFMENIMTSMLKIYDQNLENKKKVLLFQLLHQTVVLHHPQGKCRHQEGSLADNWTVWNKQLNSILEVICLEISYVQKAQNKSKKINDEQISPHFNNLSAAVYFQIFSILDTVENEASSSKKQKMSFNKYKSFHDLLNEVQDHPVPWLGIIQVYVKNFGCSLSADNYVYSVEVLEYLLAHSNINWDAYENLVRVVLNNPILFKLSDNANCIFTYLWNSCVRNSTIVNSCHKAIHTTLQHLLHFSAIKHSHVQTLYKFYIDKAMPVTPYSVTTLSKMFYKFFSKFSYNTIRNDCLTWLLQGDYTSIDTKINKELLLKLISTSNINITDYSSEINNGLSDVVFDNERCILFSEFELEIDNDKSEEKTVEESIEVNIEINKVIYEHLKQSLTVFISKIHGNANHGDVLEFMKLVNVVLVYTDITLKYKIFTCEDIMQDALFQVLKNALSLMYTEVDKYMKGDAPISVKIDLVQKLKEIFLEDLERQIQNEIRSCVHKEFFITINGILVKESNVDDEDVVYEGDEREINSTTLKHHCVLVLAAYCRKLVNFREELLNFILDPKIYDFSIDSQCIFKCLDLLNDANVEERPSEMLLTLMQYMCKDLYRDPKTTAILLKHLSKLLEVIWSSESTMKQNNCLIMIRGYVLRCQKLHYPPKVAAMIYDCVAKIVTLNRKYCLETDSLFETVLMEKVKGDIHSLRLYCSYMLDNFIVSNNDSDMYLSDLLDIFVIQVTDTQENIIKDETANRTLTVLHCFLALAQSNTGLFQKLFVTILQIQKDKSLSEYLVKKVLNKISKLNSITNFENYVNENIVSILYFWFMKNNDIDQLPVSLLGSDSLDLFIEKHKKWLISTEILWRRGGDLKNWQSFDHIKGESRQPLENLIETCFANIIALCLPYLVTEKYDIIFHGLESLELFKKSTVSAKKMFQLTGEILDSEKWTNLFVENVGDLILLNAVNLSDRKEASKMFQVDIPDCANSYFYPKTVFMAILEYVGDLTDGNIMQYLCENQPLAIFQALFYLWKHVSDENVFANKVLALHAFLTFFETVPMGQPSDAFVCNFVCKSFVHGINHCKDRRHMKVLAIGAHIVLERLIPAKVELIRKSVSQLLTILFIKIEEGFQSEFKLLFDYLMDNKQCLKDSEDVVDFVCSLSQNAVESVHCPTKAVFVSKLKIHKSSLKCASPETLANLNKLLEVNKNYLKVLYEEMSPKGFSEDCGHSIIHQIVHSLSNILKTAQDDKIIIEACNCLSQIGTYDLKTLVTIPPMDTERIVDLFPQQYMTCVVVKSLSEILFDTPRDTRKVTETLTAVLKYKEGSNALDLEQVNKEVLEPLLVNNENKSVTVKIIIRKFDEYCLKYYDGIFLKAMTNDWTPNDSNNSNNWLIEVTTTLLPLIASDDNYFNSLLEVCSIKPNVCEQILPPLVGLLLHCSSEKHIEVFSKHINNFFNYIWEQSFEERAENIGDSSQLNSGTGGVLDLGQKKVIQYMLSVVDFIRLQKSYYKTRSKRPSEMLNYLCLEYMKVSWAASVCDANLSALFYGELRAGGSLRAAARAPPGPDLAAALPAGDDMLHVFRKCYVSIGEMDAIDGCGTAHLTIENEKRKHLINTGQYTDALLLHDIAFSFGSQNDLELQIGAMRSLHKSGMHHLALQYIKSLPEQDELNDIKFECLSFLGDWSEIVDTQDLVEKSKMADSNPHSILKAFHYACLKDCINTKITPNCETKLTSVLNTAKLTVAKHCQGLNMENCQNVYKVVAKLHLFSDIEDYYSVRSNQMSTGELLSRWEVDRLPKYNDFKHLESMISQRVLMLEHAAKSCDNLQDSIIDLQMQYAKLQLSNNRIHMAQRLLALVKQMKCSDEVSLVESEVSWAKGHKEIALSMLKNIVSNTSSSQAMLTAKSLRQYALWMAESKRDSARDIIDKYLLKSLKVLDRSDHVETRLKVYYDIAKFADAEYKQVVSYMDSSIFENKVKVMESMKGTASSLRLTQHSLTRDEKKALVVNERFKELDEVEIANTKAEKESFLRLSMKYYLLSLKQCEQNNLSVFRVISLWLSNPCFEFEDPDNCSFAQLLQEIPSRKFITVLPQLAPRLTNEDTPFAENLRKIIKKCAIDHPHHTLPILFGLKNADKDRVITNASGNIGGGAPRGRVQEPRVAAAARLVRQLAAQPLAAAVAHMEAVCDATISFANYKTKLKDSKQKIPEAEKITKLRNLDAIPIPTATIPISNDCKYKYFPTLISFDNYFELVGGINCPKKVSCTDSTGHKRILLIKGEDDMRQDAVMQQVFTIVNTLLENNPVTNRNKLLIRTYKVVPMSKLSGVLEWCVGTIPIGAYLVGSNSGTDGAHARLRPQDMSCFAARKQLADYHKAGKSNKDKLILFTKILKNFKPVFHYFFTENYLDPVTWFERRLAYTKSVATSSMVGYILGLGDRHVQNILIDKNTAEVIHIDFGIAFDQGKTLQTPETVPFRLTQDIIAGFGSSGVEGTFRRCCEKTMHLLRDNSETLLTILEVLLCDPLYSWTVTSAQQNIASNRDTTVQGTSGGNSGLASRALLAVSSKLSGTEGGVAGGVGVAGQVARLLHAAADPGNLCRLFPGWQPYL